MSKKSPANVSSKSKSPAPKTPNKTPKKAVVVPAANKDSYILPPDPEPVKENTLVETDRMDDSKLQLLPQGHDTLASLIKKDEEIDMTQRGD